MQVPHSSWFNATMEVVDCHDRPQAEAASDQSQIFEKLRNLVSSPGFIYTLAYLAFKDFFLDQVHDATAGEWQQRLSADELTLVSGLTAARPVDVEPVPSPQVQRRQVTRLYNLLRELQLAARRPTSESIWAKFRSPLGSAGAGSSEIPRLPTVGDLVEPIFYSGPGAHDFQYLELAYERYRRDADWLDDNVGLSIDRLATVAVELKRLRETRANTCWTEASHAERCATDLAILSFDRSDLPFLN